MVAYGLNRVAQSDRVDLVTTTFLDWKHYPYAATLHSLCVLSRYSVGAECCSSVGAECCSRLFFGNAAFLFCIHTVAIPIHTSTKQPADYNKVLSAAPLRCIRITQCWRPGSQCEHLLCFCPQHWICHGMCGSCVQLYRMTSLACSCVSGFTETTPRLISSRTCQRSVQWLLDRY